jgi:hypothetical protein
VTFPSTRDHNRPVNHNSTLNTQTPDGGQKQSTYAGRGRRTTLGLVVTALAASLLAAPAVAASAHADEPAPSRMTARPSSFQVDPGEQFVIRGRLMSEGEPVAGAPVRVRTWAEDRFVNVKGAHVTTNSEGRYRVRVVLYRKGDRLLHVIGNPAGDDIRTAKGNVLMQVGPMPKNP